MGVTSSHLAAVADVGQDDGAGHHPGQALKRAVQLALPEDLFPGFLHHRVILAEEADAPAVYVRPPRTANRGREVAAA